MSREDFHVKLKQYLQQPGYSHQDLARALGLTPTLLSNKLKHSRNYGAFTPAEVKQIIKILAGWGVLTSQTQALELLALEELDYTSFSQEEWYQPPLAELTLAPQTSAGSNPSPLSPREHNIASWPLSWRGPARGADWQAATLTGPFYGREKDLVTLCHWVLDENCRVLGILGIGGIGKTSLALRLSHRLKDHFQVVIGYSLYNAPPLETLLKELLQVLVAPAPLALAGGVEAGLRTLLAHLQNRRVLLVLDSWETLLQEGTLAGYHRSGYENYGELLDQVGRSGHQSCLILTSREKPLQLGLVEARVSAARSLTLAGLAVEDAQPLLQDLGLIASRESQQALIKHYSGNPLALKLVAESVQTLFGGKAEAFLANTKEAAVLDEIEEMFAQQLKRLSRLEEQLVSWLALAREPLSFQQLKQDLSLNCSGQEIGEALISLTRRNLVERALDQPRFSLQPLVQEYLTRQVVVQASEEL